MTSLALGPALKAAVLTLRTCHMGSAGVPSAGAPLPAPDARAGIMQFVRHAQSSLHCDTNGVWPLPSAEPVVPAAGRRSEERGSRSVSQCPAAGPIPGGPAASAVSAKRWSPARASLPLHRRSSSIQLGQYVIAKGSA